MDRGSSRRPQINTGKISLDAIREIAQELERSNWIGTLHVSDADSEKYVYFSVGGVRLVSTGSRKYTSMGRLLVRRGVVSQHDLSKALQSQSGTQARLGDILQKWKLASKSDLERIVQLQVENEVIDIVTWEGGEYRYHRGNPGDLFERSTRATTVSLNIQPLVERMVAAAERYQKIRSKIPHFQVTYRLTTLGRQEAEDRDTAPARQDFLQLVDGRRTLAQIASNGEFGRFELADLAFEALQGGLLQPIGAAGRVVTTDRSEIQKLEAALDQALNDVLIRRKLAEAYERSGDVNKAVENYRKIADDALRSYQDDDAIGALERVTRLASTEFGAHEQLLDAYMRVGKKNRVVEQGSRMGDLYRKHRLYNRAKTVLLKVVGLAPKNVKLRSLLGDTFADLGDAPAAVREWEQAVTVLREEKSEPGQVRQYAEKILDFDAGNRVARRVLAKLGETAAPLAPIVRAATLVATAGVVAFGLWWEYSAAAEFNALATRAGPALEAGRFDEVVRDLDDLRSRRPISLLWLGEGGQESRLRDRSDRHLERRVRLALADADGSAAAHDPAAALASLAPLEEAVGGRQLAPGLLTALKRRIAELQDTVQDRGRQGARLLELLAQPGAGDRNLLSVAQQAGPEVVAPARFAGQRSLKIPLRTDPPGARVSTPEGRTIGTTGTNTDQTVKVPLKLGGRLRCRIHLAGFEPVDLDVPWTEVGWPHQVELYRQLAWPTYDLDGPPSGPPVLGGDGVSGVLVGSRDRHLHQLGRQGGLRGRRPLGLDGEVVGAPRPAAGLVLVATRAGQLRGFTDAGEERLRVTLPGLPATGPVVVGDYVACAGEKGDIWVWPVAGLAAAGLAADAAAVDGFLAIPFGQRPAGPPVGFGEDWLIMLGAEGRLASYELPGGQPRFPPRELNGRPTGAPAVTADGMAYIALVDGRLEARHVRSGATAWRQPATVVGGAGSRPVVAGDIVVVGSATDGAQTFDRKRGAEGLQYPTGAPVHARPLVAGNAVYLADRAGWLWKFGLDAREGRQWRRRLGAPVSVPLVHVGGAILVVTDEGRVAAVRD